MKIERNRLTALLIAAGISILTFTWSQWGEPTPSEAGVQTPTGPAAGTSDSYRLSPFGDMPWSNGSVPPILPSSTDWWLGARNPIGGEALSPLSTMEPPQFSADGRGHLNLDATTHANIERLLLSGTPLAVQTQLQDVSWGLPATAMKELQDLVSRFQKYTIALSQSIPPGNTVATEGEALKQLEQLHNLRASYLGEGTAQALFGEEEAMSRHMIAMAQMEKDPSLTLQQKVERAQEALSKLEASKPRR